MKLQVLMHDLTLLQDLFGNSEYTKLLTCTVIFWLVFTAPAKLEVELRAKIGHYRNRSLVMSLIELLVYPLILQSNIIIKLQTVILYLYLCDTCITIDIQFKLWKKFNILILIIPLHIIDNLWI